MKTKQSDSNKKQSVVVKDLKAKKNPKGGFTIGSISGTKTSKQSSAPDVNTSLGSVSTTK
jgi:hypothetical protein